MQERGGEFVVCLGAGKCLYTMKKKEVMWDLMILCKKKKPKESRPELY